VGRTAIFNRSVLEIADSDNTYANGLVERGGRVTSMRREVPTSRRRGPAVKSKTTIDLEYPAAAHPGAR
jgi:hypothetical protein